MERTEFDRELEAVTTSVAVEHLEEVVLRLLPRLGLDPTEDNKRVVSHLIKREWSVKIPD